MNNLISMLKAAAVAMTMFAFASGAWAEHDEGAPHDGVELGTDDTGAGGEVVDSGEVIDENVMDGEVVDEDLADDSGMAEGDGEVVTLEEGTGEEVYYTLENEAGEEVINDGSEVVEGADGEVAYDSEGNVILYFDDSNAEMAGTEMEMIPLMSTTGAAPQAVAIADTTANQAGVDSSADLTLDVINEQADFASPIDVATVSSAGGSASGSGTPTRISGGHFSGAQQ